MCQRSPEAQRPCDLGAGGISGAVHGQSWGTGTDRENPREWPGLGAMESRGGWRGGKQYGIGKAVGKQFTTYIIDILFASVILSKGKILQINQTRTEIQ